MDTQEALADLFNNYSNSEIADMTRCNYYTVTGWKFKFQKNLLSFEKQIEILTKTNYQPTQNLLWKKQAK
jgi:transposase